MAKKINVKLILELQAAGMSRNAIAQTRRMSKNSVSDVIHRAEELSLAYDDVREMGEEAVYRMFFPDKHATETLYQDPDYAYVHQELSCVGVTLKLLWEEYHERCQTMGAFPMGYTKFCNGYAAHTISNSLTNHLTHKPGAAVEVDWSGPGMEITDAATGETIKVHLFVGTLPHSQYSYVEPCLDMKQDTWLRCHVHMFQFLGGSTTRIICDNLKTGVIRHPKEGEIVLNAAYEAMGSHYMAAIMPAGVRKPKQKASVEGSVGKIATAVIAKLRNMRFYSFTELKNAVAKALHAFNNAPFQKREGTRFEVFVSEEKRFMRDLPRIPYEIANWVYGRSVNLDCHIVYGKNRYSCPYSLVGRKVDLKITDTTLEIYSQSARVATHILFPPYVTNHWSTHAEDMPDRFQKSEWDDARIKNWAYSIGKNTGEIVDRIFAGVRIKEQGYNASLSVLRLGKTYSEARLETAAELALTKIRTPRYHHLKSILAANQDILYLERKSNPEDSPALDEETLAGYVRGSNYYGGNRNDD